MVVICQHNTDTKETKENTQLRSISYDCVKNLFTSGFTKNRVGGR